MIHDAPEKEFDRIPDRDDGDGFDSQLAEVKALLSETCREPEASGEADESCHLEEETDSSRALPREASESSPRDDRASPWLILLIILELAGLVGIGAWWLLWMN